MFKNMVGIFKLFYYFFYNLIPGVKKSDVGKLRRDYLALRKIFTAGRIGITDRRFTVATESGVPVEVRVDGDEVAVFGGITLKNRIMVVGRKRLSIFKVGEKKFFDGSLWIENTQYIGDMGSVENLNIVSGGILRGGVDRVGMLYIRDGTFTGSVGAVDRFIHITHPDGLLNGRVGVINETLYIENGAFITDRLPLIKGGYAMMKEGRISKPDGSRWGLDEITARIGDLACDQEIFVSGSGGIVLLGGGAASIVVKEGIDTYSRHKTETVISSNRFFRLIGGSAPGVIGRSAPCVSGDAAHGVIGGAAPDVSGGALKEVRLEISANRKVGLPEGKFYTYVRLDIVET
jgi:hypothetical protein